MFSFPLGFNFEKNNHGLEIRVFGAFFVCGLFWGVFLASRHGTVGRHVACRLMLAIRSCPRLTGIFTHTPPLTIHHHPPLPTTIHYPHRAPIPTTTTTTFYPPTHSPTHSRRQVQAQYEQIGGSPIRCGNFDITFGTASHAFSSSIPPHTRRGISLYHRTRRGI